MICMVSYDNTLSRVRVSATAVTGTKANIDRSVDQLNWSPVRGGVTVDLAGTPVSGSIDPPVSDYEFITSTSFPSGEVCPTGAPPGIKNFYRVTAYNQPSMLTVTGGSDSFASTPDDPTLDVTGDIDIRIGIRPDQWQPPLNYVLFSKYLILGDQRSWVLRLTTTGLLRFNWSPDGTFTNIKSVDSTVPVPAFNGEHKAVRVTLDVNNGFSQHVVTFSTADTTLGPWNQLGNVVVRSGTTSIFSSTARVEIGSGNNGSFVFTDSKLLTGDVTKAAIVTGIGGTTLTSPDFTAQSPSTTTFTDAQGKVWTIHSNAFIQEDLNAPEPPGTTDQCIVSITPMLDAVWLKSVFKPFLNRQIRPLRNFPVVTRQFLGTVHDVVGRRLPIAVTDLRGSRRWQMSVCVDTVGEAREFNLMLATGDPLFLHVPGNSNLPIPSMHVAVQDTSTRKLAFSKVRVWDLQLLEAAAPGPDIVGSTSSWQTVLDTYATWQAVLDNQSTWADLLELVGDESEILVP